MKCPICNHFLPEVMLYRDNIPQSWIFGECLECKKAEIARMEMSPGTSVKFRRSTSEKAERNGGFDFVEVSAIVAQRCRYNGQMIWVDEELGVLAVFKDPVTREFYGQSA